MKKLNGKQVMKLLKKKPTYREEANALVHQCLRAGFIEDLHAGKHSKILDDNSYSRITDEEMKKLMIETSAQLTKFLKFRDKNPEKYFQLINGITLMYTHEWDKKKEKYEVFS